MRALPCACDAHHAARITAAAHLAEVPDRILHEPAVDLPLELAPALLDRRDLRAKTDSLLTAPGVVRSRPPGAQSTPCEYSEYPL